MPEGPSIVILPEHAQRLGGKVVRNDEGDSRLDEAPRIGQRILSIRSFGKQLLIELPSLTIRIRSMMFGRAATCYGSWSA